MYKNGSRIVQDLYIVKNVLFIFFDTLTTNTTGTTFIYYIKNYSLFYYLFTII
jgi:hypothetical protein